MIPNATFVFGFLLFAVIAGTARSTVLDAWIVGSLLGRLVSHVVFDFLEWRDERKRSRRRLEEFGASGIVP